MAGNQGKIRKLLACVCLHNGRDTLGLQSAAFLSLCASHSQCHRDTLANDFENCSFSTLHREGGDVGGKNGERREKKEEKRWVLGRIFLEDGLCVVP